MNLQVWRPFILSAFLLASSHSSDSSTGDKSIDATLTVDHHESSKSDIVKGPSSTLIPSNVQSDSTKSNKEPEGTDSGQNTNSGQSTNSGQNTKYRTMSEGGETILVTGGAGFIGSHCVHELLINGYNVIVIDNCVNAAIEEGSSLPESLIRVQQLTGKEVKGFYLVNLTDESAVEHIFATHNSSHSPASDGRSHSPESDPTHSPGSGRIVAVIHLAALKAVGESVNVPLKYYENNLLSTIVLLNVMCKYNVSKLIFSSSATVYGVPEFLPITERHITGQMITNPYGRTKYMIEQMLKDTVKASELDKKPFQVISLRYFNPIGAHPSGRIGEDPKGMPNNLMPFVAQVAVGRRPHLNVFGTSFNTIDGTGVRDYIHIMDLASGHVSALQYILKSGPNKDGAAGKSGANYFQAINLGSGRGHSVLEMVKAFQDATGVTVPYKIVEPREGDVDSMYADPTLAYQLFGWKTKLSVSDACRDAWKWQSENPYGFLSQGQSDITLDASCDKITRENNNNECGANIVSGAKMVSSLPVPGTGKQVV